MRGFPPAPEHQVTLANWRLPPFNRWAFSHVRQILPTAPIARAGAPVLPLRRAERALGRLAFQGPDGRERTIDRMLGETFTGIGPAAGALQDPAHEVGIGRDIVIVLAMGRLAPAHGHEEAAQIRGLGRVDGIPAGGDDPTDFLLLAAFDAIAKAVM